MRVALLYPEVYDMARFKDKRKEFPPFGVLYLAAVIEQAGHDVAVEAVSPSRTRLDLSGYDAAGFSLASSATYGLMLQGRHQSAFAGHALIMVGGVLQLLPRIQPHRFRRGRGRLRRVGGDDPGDPGTRRTAGFHRHTRDLVAQPGWGNPPQSRPAADA